MTSVVIALIASAVALVVGFVVSKVYFTSKMRSNSLSREAHEELTKRQHSQYEKKYTTLHNKARHQIRNLHQKAREKDEEIARLLSDACDESSDESPAETSAKKLVDILRSELVALRENLDSRDQRISELNLEIRDAQSESAEYLAELNTWKQKVSPLSEKMQKQREVIDSLEHERSNDTQQLKLQQGVIEVLAQEVTEATSVGHPALVEPVAHEERVDDLKAIRGIGPTLERRLKDHGIQQYRQIAEMSEEDLADLARQISISPSQASQHGWIEQARELV
jgi:predicted flap endonuclease-1-like 5' DNA nuclease